LILGFGCYLHEQVITLLSILKEELGCILVKEAFEKLTPLLKGKYDVSEIIIEKDVLVCRVTQ